MVRAFEQLYLIELSRRFARLKPRAPLAGAEQLEREALAER
jgi:hypothetical protein